MVRSGSSYTSEAQLVIDPITTDPFAANSRPVDAVNPVTERNVLRGSDVADAVIERLGLDTTSSDLLGRVEVENPEGSLALRVSVTASSPERAKEVADTFAAVYLEQRSANATDSINKVIQSIDAELATTNQGLATAINDAAAVDPGSFAGQQAQAQIATLRTRITSLEERRTALLTTSTSPGRITREADLPSSPDGIPPIVLLVGVLVAMTTVGCVVAFALDRRGGKVKDRSAFEALAPGAAIDLVRNHDELDAAVGSIALATQSRHGRPSLSLFCSESSQAAFGLTSAIVRGLGNSGLKAVVLWTGADDLPDSVKVRDDLEWLCSGEMHPIDSASNRVVWIVPAGRGGSAALAREKSAANISRWATQSGFDIVLIATPSPRLQPASAQAARWADDVTLLVEHAPTRRDLTGVTSTLNSMGVVLERVIVLTNASTLLP